MRMAPGGRNQLFTKRAARKYSNSVALSRPASSLANRLYAIDFDATVC